MHQLAEYIIGGALVASGLQSPTPAVPAMVGGLIMFNAAITRGGLAAFQWIHRRIHRYLDLGIMAVIVIAAVQPWVSVDSGSRTLILVFGVMFLVVWFGSSFTEKAKKPKGPTAPKGGDRSTDLGRTAGRLVGSGVKAARAAKAKRSN
jgi:hypothetical protein